MAERKHVRGIGNTIAPVRFLVFAGVMIAGAAVALRWFDWSHALMTGFDAGATVFLLTSIGLIAHRPHEMRTAALRNDANRAVLLVVTAAVTLTILAAVLSELRQAGAPTWSLPLVLATLTLSWLFGNTVYALHYAHLFYSPGERGDRGGITFPETPEPDYLDFFYFATCLGMTFQTSDMNITSRQIRRVVTGHCLIAFVFNLGILAFTINVLGGS